MRTSWSFGAVTALMVLGDGRGRVTPDTVLRLSTKAWACDDCASGAAIADPPGCGRARFHRGTNLCPATGNGSGLLTDCCC